MRPAPEEELPAEDSLQAEAQQLLTWMQTVQTESQPNVEGSLDDVYGGVGGVAKRLGGTHSHCLL